MSWEKWLRYERDKSDGSYYYLFLVGLWRKCTGDFHVIFQGLPTGMDLNFWDSNFWLQWNFAWCSRGPDPIHLLWSSIHQMSHLRLTDPTTIALIEDLVLIIPRLILGRSLLGGNVEPMIYIRRQMRFDFQNIGLAPWRLAKWTSLWLSAYNYIVSRVVILSIMHLILLFLR